MSTPSRWDPPPRVDSTFRPVVHVKTGIARPCSAWDLFMIRGGLQCGNCLAHNLPAPELKP